MEVPVVGRALRLPVARRRLPGPAAGRRGCTSGCAAPGRSAARRCACTPQACTSSAPKDETPTSVTQTGLSVTAADLVELRRPFVDLPEVPVERKAVHRDDVDLVQHALARQALDEARDRSATCRPSTRGRRWVLGRGSPGRRAVAISAKRSHSGSSTGSQCDLLLGSFQIFDRFDHAALPRMPVAPSVAPDRPRPSPLGRLDAPAEIDLLLRMLEDLEAGAAQHRLRRRRAFGTHQLVGSCA